VNPGKDASRQDQPLRGMVVNVGTIQPEARDLARQVASVYMQHLGPDLVSLVAHGSGVKGGLVAGSSDLDFAALVRSEALTPGGEIAFDRAVSLHNDLARIDPAPFRYIQVYVDAGGMKHGLGFIPGTFEVVYGSPDVPIASAERLLESALESLHNLNPAQIRDQLSNALLDHGEGRLHRQVRGLCTWVWPTMYHVACVMLGDSLAAWQRTKPEVVDLLGADPVVGTSLRRWWGVITAHYAAGEPVDSALEALRAGVAFLEAASVWSSHNLSESQ
jgi:hypothetical protein